MGDAHPFFPPIRETPMPTSHPPLLVWLDKTLFALACAATVLILLLQLGEITARAFGGSIVFASDATGFLMMAAVFLALPEVTRRNEHITADFVVLLMGPKARHVIGRFIAPAFGALYVLVLIYMLWALAADSYLDGVRSEGVTRLPLAIPQGLMVAALAVMLVRLLLIIAGRSGPVPEEESEAC